MRKRCLDLLCCPRCHGDLGLEEDRHGEADLERGRLVCAACATSYPIVGGVPRFVPPDNYAQNFGLQWTAFRQTQLDSHSGLTVSRDRFFRQTGWLPADLAHRTVLDVGCGAGRFTEIVASAAGHVVAVDCSASVDACRENMRGRDNVDVVQADLYALPLRPGRFDFVYSLGVLQHTPDVRAAFMALPPHVAAGGRLAVDVYPRTWTRSVQTRTWLRPVTTRMRPERLFRVVRRAAPPMLRLSRALGRVAVMGRWLQRLVPVANYEGVYRLSPSQLVEWAVLDTFDWLAPRFENPQTPTTLRRWMIEAGLEEIEVFTAHHLTARGRKPAAVVVA
jgi:uncharacterized protein YbaR (Trm112 family)